MSKTNNLANLEKMVKSHIIGIDHGYAQMKSRNFVMLTGIKESKYSSFTDENLLIFEDKNYICGSERQALQEDKTENDSYYLLTFAMIAKEIEFRKLPRKLSITLVAGLPLNTYGRQKPAFQEYLEQNKTVSFSYESKDYEVTINQVFLLPQAYSAIAPSNLLQDVPKQIIVDIGGWTVDVFTVESKKLNQASAQSKRNGIIKMLGQIKEEINSDFGVDVGEEHIKYVLIGKEFPISPEVKEAIEKAAYLYTDELLKSLKESEFDVYNNPSVFVGGGATLLRPVLEKLDNSKLFSFLDDVHANAKGYEEIVYASKK